jgi:protocatechuate 3,4-dioxygenase beta subunit
MLRIILFFILFTSHGFAQVNSAEESYSNQKGAEVVESDPNFTDVYGNAINDYSQSSSSIFIAKTPTPSRFFSADLSVPEIFSTTNNLVKKVGSFYRAFGEIIFIQGKITDSFGVPIEGAVVEIWQTNAAGKYHTLLESNSEYIDKYFNMSGKSITDNLGNYYFITILPGSNPGRAPHINMNIYHTRFGRLETEMYFKNHPYNETDYQYLAYSEEERKLLTADVFHSTVLNPGSIKLCTFNIILKGVHKFKKF